ncbi:MAG: hypothetical protein OEM81_13795 [Acidimicrobiia bacterium]|nr:hypothetical protein [Acidimicrobiia bacterium]MDH3398885.1 hypothetical protein [Acidimicrobiia bacterium]
MIQPALDVSVEAIRPRPVAVAVQRDRGLQMRLFSAHAAERVELEVDLRVSDDLAGMYYIG